MAKSWTPPPSGFAPPPKGGEKYDLMTYADKLEAEAKRLRAMKPTGSVAAMVGAVAADKLAQRDEALAAAWRGLIVADEAIGDHAVRLTDGTWVCSICKAINMINALEID